MNDFKWYNDDFQNSSNQGNNNYSAQNNYQSDFYNTTVNKKKKRFSLKKVFKKPTTAVAVSLAVVLTAVISVSGYHLVSPMLKSANDTTLAENLGKYDATETATGTKTPNVVAKSKADALSTPEIVDMVGPAVVGIINKAVYSNYDNYFGFYGGGTPEQQEVEQSSGSGVIISADGYIITNNHVIEGASGLVVILNTGDEYNAKVVGTDAKTDLAVIKIDASELPYAKLGISSDLRVGDTAIAIGNPLGQEFAGTTTQGIISGLNRSVTIDNKTLTLIQTDASINPGNSGGALVNCYGELIGINTAKISSAQLEGLGFAIPIDEAKPIIDDLIQNGYVTGRPVIGIGGRAVTEKDAKAYNLKVGVYVSSMTANSPAHLAGIKIGDIIYECEGKKVETVDDLNEIKNKHKVGDQLKMKVYRQGKSININLILGEDLPVAN